MVYRYLRTLCGNEDLAEDLMQETFYQAIKSSNRYDGSCSISTWLCQIGKHMWLRELRRQKHVVDKELDENVISKDKLIEDAYIEKEILIDVINKIQELSYIEKEVIMLRVDENLSFREIGKKLSRSESWARVTFFRAKQKLKDKE